MILILLLFVPAKGQGLISHTYCTPQFEYHRSEEERGRGIASDIQDNKAEEMCESCAININNNIKNHARLCINLTLFTSPQHNEDPAYLIRRPKEAKLNEQ